MRSTVTRQLMAGLISLCHVLVLSISTVSFPALAQQGNDLDPPVIELVAVERGTLGENQVFSATVTDNSSVETVVLHYRFTPDDDYRDLDMAAIAGTDIYSASVATDAVEATQIQYYLEAQDAASNRTIRGFAFDPLIRSLDAPGEIAQSTNGTVDSGSVSSEPAALPQESTGLGRKVLYGVLGLIVVGALASASSEGGGSTGARGTPGQNVPLLITVDAP